MQHPTPSFLSTRHATNKYLGKMKEVRWGIIGCGEVTEKKSGPAFNEVEGSHVEAVFSRNETKARSYAERHHVRKWYTDPQELILDPDINAIYVATPPAAHTTFAIMSMRAGKPCYVEKPLAASYEDCIRINHISEQTGVRCYVAYYRRYLPYFKKVKTLINSGVLGKIMTVQVRLIAPPKPQDAQTGSLPWRLQSSISGGGYFYDLAPIRSTSSRTTSASSPKPTATRPTAAVSMPWRTRSMP